MNIIWVSLFVGVVAAAVGLVCGGGPKTAEMIQAVIHEENRLEEEAKENSRAA